MRGPAATGGGRWGAPPPVPPRRAAARRRPSTRSDARWRPAALAALCLVAATASSAQAPAEPEIAAWSHLEALRDALTAAPREADFTQTFRPAGFSTGETESGSLALALPDCLRWDYVQPFAKSFLLCGRTVHAWNEGETSGRRQAVEAGDDEGLDLLKLSVDDLRQRYRAGVEPVGPGDAGGVVVILTPRRPGGEVTEARFTLDAGSRRLDALAYRDVEGNQTRFDFSGHRPLSSRGHLDPPEDIEWLED